MRSSKFLLALSIAVPLFAVTARVESQPPPPALTEPERQAKIVDQLERLVSRPNPIALSVTQRHAIDSLKAKYLKEVLLHEKASSTKDPMEAGQEFRKNQLLYYEAVQKLLTPSQLPDFEKNRYAASFRGS